MRAVIYGTKFLKLWGFDGVIWGLVPRVPVLCILSPHH